MDIKAKKLHFIQEVLALTNEKVIDKLESLLKREKLKKAKNTSAHDLLGVMTKDEARDMKQLWK
ncbi:hypothetical protein [Roseivirga seohaensis]|uniref:hypothetical protein n=1 Tax=Roseivirga seohaensis TaxID=1914963 RepID=UPI003BA9E1DA